MAGLVIPFIATVHPGLLYRTRDIQIGMLMFDSQFLLKLTLQHDIIWLMTPINERFIFVVL